jgi:uncharacterized phage-associated protein
MQNKPDFQKPEMCEVYTYRTISDVNSIIIRKDFMKILLDIDENIVIIQIKVGKLVEMKKQTNPIKFSFDPNKAIQAVLWLLYRNNQAMDKLQLIKLFFYADHKHLIEYGRPIAGGEYYVMTHGPVCSELLNILDSIQQSGVSNLPLKARGAYDIVATTPPDTQLLSESDLNVLDEIYRRYGHMDKWKLRDMTHELTSCKKNEPREGEKRHALPYEDFFEDCPDEESKKMLRVILDEQQAWADFV